jgi:hypothetical protein
VALSSLTPFSLALSLAHAFSNHFPFCALVVIFSFVHVNQFCAHFILALFQLLPMKWLMFYEVGLAIALCSLCFGLYL